MVRQNSKTLGDETEISIIHELVMAGYGVSLPFGDNDPYDIIVDDDGDLYRVQCKTAWLTSVGTIRFNTHSQTIRDGEYVETTYPDEIDAFAVRAPHNHMIYWVDIQDATDQKMDLRYEAKIDHPSINWAQDFEFQGDIQAEKT